MLAFWIAGVQDFTAISRERDGRLLVHPAAAVSPNERTDILLNNTRERGSTELHSRSYSSTHETARICNLQDINGIYRRSHFGRQYHLFCGLF